MSARVLLLLAGPSGAGKSSVVRPVVDADPRLAFSVSCTTRAPRPGERDGVDYHFLTRAEFERQRDEAAFLECAQVHGQLYGTRAADLDTIFARGQVPVLDVDVQGGAQIRRRFRGRIVSVFIEPPSLEELERRLRGRGTEDEAALQIRLRNARGELAEAGHYQHRIVNAELEQARAELRALLQAELWAGA
jgi:guanylate kinase